MKAGFIGLGRMGVGMVQNLLKAGHAVTVYNRSPDKIAPVVALGAKAASSIAEAAHAEVIITMLSDDAAVESVVFGDAGMLRHMAPHAIHVSSSTISTKLVETLTREHAKANQGFVAAPVFGRPDSASAGTLYVVAAGERRAVTAVSPLLDAIGQKTFVVSDAPRLAALVKLSGNFLMAAVIESLGEAIALIAKGGIDRAQYVELLTSTLFTAPVYKTYGKLLAGGKFTPAGFPAPLGAKDIRLVLSAAEGLNVPLPLASLLRDRFLSLLAHHGDSLDWSAVGELASRDAAITRNVP